MKIYTRRGDTGETDLYASGRVSKDNPRIEVCGTIDELNSTLGEVRSTHPDPVTDSLLQEIQQDLFVLGADLVTIGKQPNRGHEDVPRATDERVAELEAAIDRLDEKLEPMTAFILPGGSPSGAKLHSARTVCRRAERICTKLAREEDVSRKVIRYLNRLSDLLFVMARYENNRKGVAETQWLP